MSLNDGLQHYWAFSGNAKDSIRTSPMDLSVTGATNGSAYGKVGNGYNFTDLQNLNYSSSHNVHTCPTVSAWFWYDPAPTKGGMVVSWTDSLTNAGKIQLNSGDTSLGLRWANLLGEWDWSSIAGIAITKGVWVHVVGVYDVKQGLAYAYVNGELKATKPNGGVPLATGSSTNFRIGGWYGNNNNDWKGYIDEVGFWNRALSADEVKLLYRYGMTGISYPFPSEKRAGRMKGAVGSVGNVTKWQYYSPAIYGYALGGVTGTDVTVTTADRITFSTQTTASSTVSNLSAKRGQGATATDRTLFGYTFGGDTSGAANVTAISDRLTFSTSATAANTASNLSQARRAIAGVSSTWAGYMMGGVTGAAVTTTDRIFFATGVTAANTVSNIPTARWGVCGVSDGYAYGYGMGGYTGTLVTATNRLTYSTEVCALNTASNLSVANWRNIGLSDNTRYGYSLSGASTNTDRINFSSSVTAANTTANTTILRIEASACSDGTTYGYCCGGYSTTQTNTTDQIVFSTSVTSAKTTANLSSAKYSNFGFSDYAV